MEECLALIAPVQPGLDQALAAVAAAKATTTLTLRDKRAAMARFDDRFGRVGRYVKAAYELVRLDDLAAKVPPRTPRKSRRKTAKRRVRQSRRRPRQLAGALTRLVERSRRLGGWLFQLGTGWERRQA